MLKHLLVSSCIALSLIGCTTTETKPVTSTTPNLPANVVHPVAKAVKPVLKPKVVAKPKTVPLKTAEPVSVSSDEALGKQWAACAGRINGLYLFGQDALNANPAVKQQPRFKGTLSDYKKLPMLRDSLYAYAWAAASPAVVATEFNRVSAADHQAMKRYMDGFLHAVATGESREAANDKWGERYFKHGNALLADVMKCTMALEQQHTRFDAQVRPSLQVKALESLFTTKAAENTPKKVTKKRERKAR